MPCLSLFARSALCLALALVSASSRATPGQCSSIFRTSSDLGEAISQVSTFRERLEFGMILREMDAIWSAPAAPAQRRRLDFLNERALVIMQKALRKKGVESVIRPELGWDDLDEDARWDRYEMTQELSGESPEHGPAIDLKNDENTRRWHAQLASQLEITSFPPAMRYFAWAGRRFGVRHVLNLFHAGLLRNYGGVIPHGGLALLRLNFAFEPAGATANRLDRHEVDHLFLIEARRRGVETPYQIEWHAVGEHEVPAAIRSYRKYMSFEELFAYGREVRRGAQTADPVLFFSLHGVYAESPGDAAFSSADALAHLSRMALELLDRVDELLARAPEEISFEVRDDASSFALAPIRKDGVLIGHARIDLVGLTPENQGARRAMLERYLGVARAAADRHLAQAIEALGRLPKREPIARLIPGTDDPNR